MYEDRNRAKSQAISMLKNRNECRAHIYDEDTLRNMYVVGRKKHFGENERIYSDELSLCPVRRH